MKFHVISHGSPWVSVSYGLPIAKRSCCMCSTLMNVILCVISYHITSHHTTSHHHITSHHIIHHIIFHLILPYLTLNCLTLHYITWHRICYTRACAQYYIKWHRVCYTRALQELANNPIRALSQCLYFVISLDGKVSSYKWWGDTPYLLLAGHCKIVVPKSSASLCRSVWFIHSHCWGCYQYFGHSRMHGMACICDYHRICQPVHDKQISCSFCREYTNSVIA